MMGHYMFRVADRNDVIHKVFWVKDDRKTGYPMFLIRNEETNQWLWKSAKHFVSIDEWATKVEKEYY